MKAGWRWGLVWWIALCWLSRRGDGTARCALSSARQPVAGIDSFIEIEIRERGERRCAEPTLGAGSYTQWTRTRTSVASTWQRRASVGLMRGGAGRGLGEIDCASWLSTIHSSSTQHSLMHFPVQHPPHNHRSTVVQHIMVAHEHSAIVILSLISS